MRRSYKTLRHLLLWVAVALAASLAGPWPARAQEMETRYVLVLHAYHQGYKWTDDINAGIRSVLSEVDNVEILVEYMDTKRVFDDAYLQQLSEFYAHKYQDYTFEVIISSDDNAFNFLLERRDELFPGTPVVFCGVNFFDPDRLGGRSGFTGVNEVVDVQGTLDIALQLHPERDHVVIINDTTPTGQRLHERIEQIMSIYEDRIEFSLWEDVTMGEIRDRVASLPSDTLVLYTLFFRDSAGQFFEYDNSIELIAENSAVPIYGTWDFSLGYGIVGGRLVSGFSQGEAAAQLASRVLQGESPAAISFVMETPTRAMFDYAQMQAYDLTEDDLPPDSVIINQEFTFFQLYRDQVLFIVATLAGLTLTVFVLATNMTRRQQTEQELLESNRELRWIRDNLEQRVEQRTEELAQRAVQLEAAAQVSRATTSVLDLQDLLAEVVDVVQERFGLYYVGLFLVQNDDAVLSAGTGAAGREMLNRQHHLEVGGNSMIGQCVAQNRPIISLDVEGEALRFENPLLPDTRSELALPMRARGEVVGALSVQSVEENAFDDAYIAVLQTMADQVAIAISNARLFAETQAALAEAEAVHRRYLGQAWTAYTRRRTITGYQRTGEELTSLSDELLPLVRQALGSRDVFTKEGGALDDDARAVLALPVRQRGGVAIGAMGVEDEDVQRHWSEDDLALVRAIGEQFALAVENLRLVEQTQDLAQRERLISEITARIRESLNLDTVLQTAVQEIREAAGVPELTIRLAEGVDMVTSSDPTDEA